MTIINLSFCPLKSGKGNLCYHVIHQATHHSIRSGIKIATQDWDAVNNCIISPTPKHLTHVQSKIKSDISRLEHIARKMNKHGRRVTARYIAEIFNSKANEYLSFAEFTNEIIGQLIQNNHIRTSETYMTALKCLERFRGGIMLDEIDSDMIMAFEAWMLGRGLTKNTTSFYMRILRAIYNRAIERGLVEHSSPFKYVYTGIDKTIKRAIDLNAIRKLKALDLSNAPSLSLARDIFLFSFYTRGMAFVDIAYLRKSDLNGSRLKYRRSKTKQLLTIGWEKCMQEIVDRYDTGSSPYLLPIITQSGNERQQYLHNAHKINRHLKVLGKMIKLQIPLTMYVARHSWASIARNKHIPLSIISESMGHESEKTTRIYLSTIDYQEIDRANRIILRSI